MTEPKPMPTEEEIRKLAEELGVSIEVARKMAGAASISDTEHGGEITTV